MSFLTPLFLLGGLAIAGPIIFHLVRRTTRQHTLFSSLMFLLPSPPRLSKQHRIEHLLLLLLRCLALALLALGFARPFLRQAPIDDPTAAQPRRLVVLVDTSASMRRAGVWEAARERVGEIVRRAGPADQVAIYPFDRQATPLVAFEDWNRAAPGDRAAFVLGRLETLAPSWRGTHLGNALVTAAEALAETEGKASGGIRQIALVSDLQAGSRLEALQSYEWPKGVEVVVETVGPRNRTNAGVQLVAEAPDAGRRVDAPVRVRVTNAPESARERFTLGWTRPGANGAVEPVGAPLEAYVPPGQSRVFSLPLVKDAPGLQRIALQGDDEAFDNVAFVIPPAQQKAMVLWLGSEAPADSRQPLFFLRRAFADTPRIAVEVVARPPGGPVSPAELQAASLVFIAEPVSPELAAALRAQAQAGKTLVVVPKTAAASPTLGALLEREVRLEEARPANYAMLSEIDFQHPLFAPFADPRFSDFTKIHVWKYRKLDPASIPGARVVAKFDSGDPAVLESPLGRGKLYFLAAGWHAEDSQLAVSSKFVPLLWSLLELSGGVTTVTTQYAVGDRVPLPAATTGLRTPAGADVAVAAGGGDFTATSEPGVYEIAGGGPSPRFAVNLDANESRTSPLGLDELEQFGVPLARERSATETAPPESKTLLQGIEAENRQKLWRWFLVATLALLLFETALAGWTARRASSHSAEVPS